MPYWLVATIAVIAVAALVATWGWIIMDILKAVEP